MKIAVVGLGAMGGLIAAKLVQAGYQVQALARGKTLQAVQTHGLQLEQAEGLLRVDLVVSDQAERLGKHDLVIVAVKAQALAGLAGSIASLRADDGVVLTAMNGVPWWFFQGLGGSLNGLKLKTVDPEGLLDRSIPHQAIIGAVLHMSASTPSPAKVLHAMGSRIIVGEPGGGSSQRLEALTHLLRSVGFAAEASMRIQDDIWFKLWGNMTMNPVSAITGATIDKILDDPAVYRLCVDVMQEARLLGESFGCCIDQTPQERQAVTRQLGAFKTSMLQDVEASRPVELDALLTVVHEIARQLAVETPWIDALLGLSRLTMQTRGLYPHT
ncbi:MAG: 2-dehydropantoate 2-reductase [Betaproteobacteria bacterium]|nr:2-dehydropantoate 2-reductase [Betaproteobacteria bacterium]